jgi:hypothetical protein
MNAPNILTPDRGLLKLTTASLFALLVAVARRVALLVCETDAISSTVSRPSVTP